MSRLKSVHLEGDPRRDLRGEILAAAMRLFIQQGYHELSMRALAEAVGVSKAALYYHFRDKEELFLALLDLYLAEIERLLVQIQAVQTNSQERIRRLVEGILAQPAEQRAMIRLASQEMAQLSGERRVEFNRAYHTRFLNRVTAILEEGMASGELRPVDPGVATWALLGMMFPYFYPAHFSEMPPSKEVAEQLASLYLEGMTNK